MSASILDTNFVIRYLLDDEPLLSKESKKIFSDIRSGKVKAHLEQAVFAEIIFVLASFYKVPKIKITETLSELLRYKGIIADTEILLQALSFYQEKNLHIVDCLVIAKATKYQLDVLTFDKALSKKYEDCKI